MKKENKKIVKKIIIVLSIFVLYAFTLLFFIWIASRTTSNTNEEQLIEIGHNQGRKQVLDSLENLKKYENTRKKQIKSGSN